MTGYLFDLDYTLLRSDHLRNDLGNIAQGVVPVLPEGLWESVYEADKSEHGGRVDMHRFLSRLATEAGLYDENRSRLLGISEYVPFAEYLFDKEHTLLRQLGPRNVFIHTQTDLAWGHQKIRGLRLPPEIEYPEHVIITPDKSMDEQARVIQGLVERGYATIVAVNDNPKQLAEASRIAPEIVRPVLMEYGPYAHDPSLREQAAGVPLTVAHTFADLGKILLSGRGPEIMAPFAPGERLG